MKPLSSDEIFGNWATLLLATDNKERIDYSKLADEIDILISSHPNGIYSNGTAGEFYTQTEDEFLKISELLAEKCERSGIPFQIGVSHMSPQISLQRLKSIQHFQPGAVQVILPDWFPPTLPESIVFLRRMAEEAGEISLILYNPPHAKKKLSPEDWKTIKRQIPSLMGVKCSTIIPIFSGMHLLKKTAKGSRYLCLVTTWQPGLPWGLTGLTPTWRA